MCIFYVFFFDMHLMLENDIINIGGGEHHIGDRDISEYKKVVHCFVEKSPDSN